MKFTKDMNHIFRISIAITFWELCWRPSSRVAFCWTGWRFYWNKRYRPSPFLKISSSSWKLAMGVHDLLLLTDSLFCFYFKSVVKDAFIVKVFDQFMSPRAHAIVAFKSKGQEKELTPDEGWRKFLVLINTSLPKSTLAPIFIYCIHIVRIFNSDE